MKAHGYEDNAGVLSWRGSEAAACPDQSDLHRQQICFSRKTTQPVYRRGSVAWRIARVATSPPERTVEENTVPLRKPENECGFARLRRPCRMGAPSGAPRLLQETIGHFFSRMNR